MLFVLRGVNHEELIDVTAAISDATKTGTSRRRIASSGIEDIFGIEIAGNAEKQPIIPPAPGRKATTAKTKKKASTSSKTAAFPDPLTGEAIRSWRMRLGETQALFAARFGVTAASVLQWERKDKKLVSVSSDTAKALRKVWKTVHCG